jgi:hypothetical protein
MDGSAFDRLVRHIGEDASRRGLLRSAVAATVAGLGAASILDADDAEAKSCKKKCNKKNSSSARKKCKKKCNKNQTNDTDTLALRQACTSSSQCVGNLLCSTVTSPNGCPGQETGTFCCGQPHIQQPCNNECDCCGFGICNGGYCD